MEIISRPITAIVFQKEEIYQVTAEQVTDLTPADAEQAKRLSQAWEDAQLSRVADVLHNSLTARGNTIISQQQTGTLSEVEEPYQKIQQTPGYFAVASSSNAVNAKLLEAPATESLVVSGKAVQLWAVVPNKPKAIRIIGFEDRIPDLLEAA